MHDVTLLALAKILEGKLRLFQKAAPVSLLSTLLYRDDIPPITEAQAEALDYLHYTAEKYSLSINFKKGDIQYISNTSIFHARNSYSDSAEKR